MNEWNLIPQGTALQAFQKKSAELDGTSYEAPNEFQTVKDYCRDLNLDEGFFVEAHEMCSWWFPDLSADKKEAIMALLLLSQKFLSEGNTCLPFKSPSQEPLLQKWFIHSGMVPEQAEKYEKDLFPIIEGDQFTNVFGKPDEFTPFILDTAQGNLYHQRNYLSETTFRDYFTERLSRSTETPPMEAIQAVLSEIFKAHPIRLPSGKAIQFADEQQLAMLLAVFSPVTIISGGPGTGKTSIVVMILRLLSRLGLADLIGLAAPTGRAAKRMAEAIQTSMQSVALVNGKHPDQKLIEQIPESQTLHRLLGYSPRLHRFKYHENNPLNQQVLIVDETSMIDLAMMAKLIKAITPLNPKLGFPARIIFLGDANQLPSVGAGAVLRDLVPENPSLTPQVAESILQLAPHLADVVQNYGSKKASTLSDKVVQLVTSFRQTKADPQGRNILGVAKKVISWQKSNDFEGLFVQKGEDDETITKLKALDQFDCSKVHFLEQSNSKQDVDGLAKFWLEQFFLNNDWSELRQKVYPAEILQSSSEDLSTLFADQRKCRILTAMRVSQSGSVFLNRLFQNQLNSPENEFFVGAPVMVQKNDYENDLFNGDEGICLKILNPQNQRTELKVVFAHQDGYRSFYPHQLPHLQLSFAITIHKSQGSEFDHVAVVLPAESNSLLVKEMVYTAITRAKKSVLLIGPAPIFHDAIRQKVERFSGLNF